MSSVVPEDPMMAAHILKIKTRIKEIQEELSTHAITRNRKRYSANGISEDVIVRRQELTPELIRLEKELTRLKIFTNPTVSYHDDFKLKTKEVLIEIFGEENTNKILSEANSRAKGLMPSSIKISYGYNEKDSVEIKRLKAISENIKQMLIQARRAIDLYIRENEPEVNKGTYISSVSKINKAMPSESDIHKIKI